MREIKFRAWDGEMVVSGFCIGAVTGNIFVHEAVDDHFEHKARPNWKLMQFTGLLDKNGTEIYEGDVVDWRGVDGSQRAKVVWCEGLAKFGVEFDEDGRVYGFSKYEAERNFEIIGNIYENPELLK